MKDKKSFIFIAGPCVIESEDIVKKTAVFLKELTSKYELDFIFKASFDKANRTSIKSFRGPGIERGLKILARLKDELKIKILTDIHTPAQAEKVAEVVDVIQIPAFLCRQTDLILAAARTGKIINIKKGQFIAPQDMKYIWEKIESVGRRRVFLTERGTFFGYHNLVVDFRSFAIMARLGFPVIFDVTHSLQLPAAGAGISGGEKEFALPLARAAVAFGVDGLFCEIHPQPEKALSDSATSLDFAQTEELLKDVFSLLSLKS